jgi:predicted nucleic acid-binding protein
MSVLYAESSAVLEWLLGTERGATVRAALSAASSVVASDLTTAEVARTLRRLTATGQLTPEQRTESYGLYMAAAAHWIFWAVDQAILTRAGEAFGVEPVRTLDAIHLATAVAFRAEVEAVVVCSLDHRVRLNAKALGLKVSPVD